MEARDIKTLIALMNQHGLVELEIEDKKGKIRLVRGADAALGRRMIDAKLAPSKRDAIAADSASLPAGEPIELGANQRIVESPMVGTFYRAPSPGAPPFVEEGSSVRKGQALCIIEAMKMMNEIEAPLNGRVVKILCDNGKPVQYSQPLMVLEVG